MTTGWSKPTVGPPKGWKCSLAKAEAKHRVTSFMGSVPASR